MRRVIQSPRAKRDVRGILKYLAERYESAAAQFATDLADRMRLIAGQPRMGRARDDPGVGFRTVVVGRYVVVYSFTDDDLRILRIIHGSRDVPSEFGDPG